MVRGIQLQAMQIVRGIRSLSEGHAAAADAVPLELRQHCAAYIRYCEKRRVFETLAQAQQHGSAYQCDYCDKAHTHPLVDHDVDERVSLS